MSQRILSGKWKGQTLAGSVGSKTRPTTSMMRQAVFNIWSSQVTGSRFLDLFAGTGAIGFEALSLQAQEVTLVEKDRAAIKGLKKSMERFKDPLDQSLVLCIQDVQQFLESKRASSFDLVYADPPYDWCAHKGLKPGYYVSWLLLHLEKWAKSGTRVMIEQARHVKEPIDSVMGSFIHLESRQYGDSMIHHFEFRSVQSIEPGQDLPSR